MVTGLGDVEGGVSMVTVGGLVGSSIGLGSWLVLVVSVACMVVFQLESLND